MIPRRTFVASTLAAVALPASAQPQPWPSKPIKLVVPYAPGGTTDVVARMVAEYLGKQLGQNIIVDNKPGKGAMVGTALVAKAAPDGYSVVTVIAAHAANATLYQNKLPFDPVKSFAPVSLAVVAPLILTVNNNFAPKNVKELIDYAKKYPGKISFGSSGIGAAAHLTTELFKQTTGVDMVHIPYKGTAPALAGLMGTDIQVLVDVPSTLMPHVRGGKVRAIAMFSAQRVPGAQEVPTIVESGGPLIEASTWLLFLAPAGTPKAIVDRLSQEASKVIQSPEMRARFDQLGIFPGGGTPEQASKFLADEIAKWSKVITTAGVKAE